MDPKKRHSKINDQIRHELYIWITYHPQVVQSQIFNDCLKIIFGDQIVLQMVPKLLHQVFVRKLHNTFVGDPNDGGIQEGKVRRK